MSEEEARIDDHIYEKYDVIEMLGKGAYGVVWKVVDKKHQKTWALKKIFKAFQNSTDAQRTFREVVLLKRLEHENIIKLYDIINDSNDEDIYLVFEYMDSDLNFAIKAGILGDDHKRYIVYQLLKSLLFLHSASVIHRDIKPENLLLDTACLLKVADFGLARSITENTDDKDNAVMTDYVATRWYRAPEILLGSELYTKGVDIWSVGCIIAELYGAKPLFPGKSTLDQIARIVEVTNTPSDSVLVTMGSDYAVRMMNSIRRVMPRSLEAMYPECDADTIDIIEKCLKFSPDERITIEQLLEHPYVAAFREEEEELRAEGPVVLPIDDVDRRPVDVYRTALYEMMDVQSTPSPERKRRRHKDKTSSKKGKKRDKDKSKRREKEKV